MLDLILLPAALVLALGLRAARRGHFRTHAHFMASGVALLGLRLALSFPGLPLAHRSLGLGCLALAAGTLLLGRQALAWREGGRGPAGLLRVHRAFGALTLVLLAFAAAAWLLRRWV